MYYEPEILKVIKELTERAWIVLGLIYTKIPTLTLNDKQMLKSIEINLNNLIEEHNKLKSEIKSRLTPDKAAAYKT